MAADDQRWVPAPDGGEANEVHERPTMPPTAERRPAAETLPEDDQTIDHEAATMIQGAGSTAPTGGGEAPASEAGWRFGA
ncbi:MAG TPA: hypothetical protein VG406_00725 [Isosphaeraceae bacterium]|nr:hypothetical protein [Isosphaeraceae bacterium]